MTRRQLGQLEAEVLAALAAADGPVATAELRSRLSGDPAYTTVNTILFRLYEKRLVTRVRVGRHYQYRLAVDEAQLVAGRMHDHLRYASNASSVLSQFVQTLSADEAQALREILDSPGDTP
ncbi:BlaI/MecI/CopY family transcriptional regulator [Actinomadura sp. HBU206391]|nr:BlaI/MecI/CopY family transcriptional regulator [Actinomadura sp. HBU206391]